ncbi:hypothetical protein [Haliscomenobacter sp.]|uniref:hypothetical protein n=1 Tax=Haliscomenobacter sp. TaxID=2717303 RepID=UPI003BABF138
MISKQSYLLPLFVLLVSTAACQNKPNPTSGSTTSSKASTVAQTPLKAAIKAVYPDKDPAFNFQADVKVESGVIKTGDKIDAVSADGKRFTFVVVKIRNPFEDIKSADKESGTVYLMLSGPKDAVFNSNFSFVSPGAPVPASQANTKSTDGLFMAQIDGAAWTGNGFANSHLFYKGGVKQFNDGKPSLMLTFKAVNGPDNRQLNVLLTTADAKPGIYSGEQIELLLSGSPLGDEKNSELYGHKYPDSQGRNLKVEISSYRENGNGTATISGKISGFLSRPLGMAKKSELSIENGVFNNVVVTVYNGKY